MLTVWQWEHKLLEQEVEYYEDHLRRHKSKMDGEVNAQLVAYAKPDIDFLKAPIKKNQSKKGLKGGDQQKLSQRAIIQQVEGKYEEQTRALLSGYNRAIRELKIHEKQKNSKKYVNLLMAYGDGVDEFAISKDQMQPVVNVYERNKGRFEEERAQKEANEAAATAASEALRSRSSQMNH